MEETTLNLERRLNSFERQLKEGSVTSAAHFELLVSCSLLFPRFIQHVFRFALMERSLPLGQTRAMDTRFEHLDGIRRYHLRR